MKDAKPIKTPMGTNGHLDLDTGGKSMDQKVYRSMIGSLLYLCASRPDIMLSVCMCARFKPECKTEEKRQYFSFDSKFERLAYRRVEKDPRELVQVEVPDVYKRQPTRRAWNRAL